MQAPGTTKFESTKAYDVLVAAPLILFYILSIFGLGPQFGAALHVRPFWLSTLKLAEPLSDALYFTLVIALVFLRRMPIAKARNLLPRVAALLGSFLLLALPLLLRRVNLSPLVSLMSTVLKTGTTLAELLILSHLGKSFSIMPEARKLVMTGPYRYVRHPLYLASIFGAVGVMLEFVQPWALLIVLAAVSLQLIRIYFEEKILRDAFPEYTDYAALTWRLVPGVY